MRTTLSIDDHLLAATKTRAAKAGKTLDEYVEDALREKLLEPDRAPTPVDLPVFTKGTGFAEGVDGTSNRSLYDALDRAGALR